MPCCHMCLQAYLASSDFGSAEDQVEALIRKHEAFDNVLAVQEEKVCEHCTRTYNEGLRLVCVLYHS